MIIKRMIVVFLLTSFSLSIELLAQGPPDPGGSPEFGVPPLGGGAPLGDDFTAFVILGIAYLVYRLKQERSRNKKAAC